MRGQMSKPTHIIPMSHTNTARQRNVQKQNRSAAVDDQGKQLTASKVQSIPLHLRITTKLRRCVTFIHKRSRLMVGSRPSSDRCQSNSSMNLTGLCKRRAPKNGNLFETCVHNQSAVQLQASMVNNQLVAAILGSKMIISFVS